MEKRGFVTIATGKDEYYVLAKNLLLSYKFFAKEPLPFAIICDRENEITKLFDKVIILPEPTNSYLDKLELFKLDLFEESIFIDADCLIYDDINFSFSLFENATCVSSFGEVLPKDSDNAWFNCNDLKDKSDGIDYSILFHGGLMYIRQEREKLDEFYSVLKEVSKNYYDYNFKLFSDPADEPIVAYAMAKCNFKPIGWEKDIVCYYFRKSRVLCDMINNKVYWRRYKETGTSIISHFGNVNTDKHLYLGQIKILNELINGNADKAEKLNKKYLRKRKFLNKTMTIKNAFIKFTGIFKK